MTRMHFEAIAQALRVTRPEPTGDILIDAAHRGQWVHTRDAITRELYAFNPNFDRGRFEQATER